MPETLHVPSNLFPKPPTVPASAHGAHKWRLGWLAVLAAVLMVSNLAVLPFLASAPPLGRPSTPFFLFVGLMFGNIMAEVPVLSFFAVLGPGTSLPRQGVVWLVALLLLTSFAVGTGVANLVRPEFSLPLQTMLAFILTTPVIFCAGQTPLWMLRYFLRWRTAIGDDAAPDSGQISIRGMMAATAVIAVALGLCRLGLAVENRQWDGVRFGQPLNPLVWWSGVGLAAVTMLAASTVILPAISLLVLRSRSAILGISVAATYMAGCTLMLIAVVSTISGDWPDGDGLTLLSMYYISITGCTLSSLAIFRSAGYRLRWGWGRDTRRVVISGTGEDSSPLTP